MNRKLAMFFVFLAMTFGCLAQETEVDMYGTVTEHFEPKPVRDAEVRVIGGRVLNPDTVIQVDRKGRYLFAFVPGQVYITEFSAPGRVTKRLMINTKAVPQDGSLYLMEVQVTMMDSIDGFDFSAFDKPIAEAEYDKGIRNMTWQTNYTLSRSALVAKAIADYEKQAGGYLAHDGTTWKYVGSEDSLIKDADLRFDTAVVINVPVQDTVVIQAVEPVFDSYYSIQLGVYSSTVDSKSVFGLSDVRIENLPGGEVRYLYGRFKTKDAAEEMRKAVLPKVPDAFIVERQELK